MLGNQGDEKRSLSFGIHAVNIGSALDQNFHNFNKSGYKKRTFCKWICRISSPVLVEMISIDS